MFCNACYLHITDFKTNSFHLKAIGLRSTYLDNTNKVAHGLSQYFFFHEPEYYNIISMLKLRCKHQTKSCFYRYFVYQVSCRSMRPAPFARKSEYNFVLITKSMFYLISNHIFVHNIHLGYFFTDNKVICTQIYRVYGCNTETESTN